VLAAAAGTRDRPARRAWLAPIALGAAAAGVVGYVALALPSAHRSHGIVHPHAGAHYVVTTVGRDEVIRLTEGVIDVEVEPLLPGERFRVVIGDAELEVRGTAFTVSAVDERLVDVSVAHGRVDVRPRTGAPATLGNGQSWRGSATNAAAPPAFASRASPSNGSAPPSPDVPSGPPAMQAKQVALAATGTGPPRAASSASGNRGQREPATASDHGSAHAAPGAAANTPERGPPGISESATRSEPEASPVSARAPEERAYDQAWGALRANDFARAASGFARVLLLTPDSPLVEDASFWRAVALARGQRTVEAVSAFRDFVDGFPTSARAGEASAMLGWLLIDERAYDEAARRFRLAARDASPAVRKSAQSGLDALARRRP
jgi:hypothetical protein